MDLTQRFKHNDLHKGFNTTDLNNDLINDLINGFKHNGFKQGIELIKYITFKHSFHSLMSFFINSFTSSYNSVVPIIILFTLSWNKMPLCASKNFTSFK